MHAVLKVVPVPQHYSTLPPALRIGVAWAFDAAKRLSSLRILLCVQTYYKLPYVDHAITNPEQRICEGATAAALMQGKTGSLSAQHAAIDPPGI